jgi:hypothetical protein
MKLDGVDLAMDRAQTYHLENWLSALGQLRAK